MKPSPSLLCLLHHLTLCLLLLSPVGLVLTPATGRADDPSIGQQTKTALQNAGEEAKAGLDDIKDRAADSIPDHHTVGEVASLLIIGVFVGAVAGLLTSLSSTFLGNLGRLLLGLAGAFIGGFLLRFTGWKLGLGTLVINYDEVVFAFGGAILLLGIGRLLGFKSRKKAAGQ